MTEGLQQKRAPYVVEWREAFKVQIPQVDAEHHRLFDIIRALDLGTIDETISELLDYVVTHFTNEQALMEQSGVGEDELVAEFDAARRAAREEARAVTSAS